MPRASKFSKLAEAHESTMLKAPTFEIWVKRTLQDQTRVDDYRKAYNIVHGVKSNDNEAAAEQESTD